jgi:hypothetical protein
MEEILLFIEKQQTWIYIGIGIFALIYSSATFRAYRDFRRAIFSLERERATNRLIRSAAMLALVFSGMIATFVIANFAGPALPISARQPPIPTVSLLATASVDNHTSDAGFATATPLALLESEGLGCLNPDATLTSPQDGESISGIVKILGTADIQNFAFYKVEYRSLTPESSWLTVSAGTVPVCEGKCEISEELGSWDTSLVSPGEYDFRLVVTDTVGNAPLPCEIQLRVLPAPP